MRETYARFKSITAPIIWIISACYVSTQAGAASSEPSLVLASSASEASPDGIVSVVLAGTNLPEGATITLYAPLKGDLWVASPDCASLPRGRILTTHATTGALLCMTSSERQTLRAIASVPLPGDHVLIARSEPVKFYAEHWWSSPGFLSVFTTLLGAAAGIAGTLFTQRADHSRKIRDDAKALEHEQAAFVIKSLLPELLSHNQVLSANRAPEAADVKNLQSLPRPNLIQVMDSERAKALLSYFDARGNAQLVAQLTEYCSAADAYNDAVQGTKRGTQLLETLTARGEGLMEKLKALGVAG